MQSPSPPPLAKASSSKAGEEQLTGAPSPAKSKITRGNRSATPPVEPVAPKDVQPAPKLGPPKGVGIKELAEHLGTVPASQQASRRPGHPLCVGVAQRPRGGEGHRRMEGGAEEVGAARQSLVFTHMHREGVEGRCQGHLHGTHMLLEPGDPLGRPVAATESCGGIRHVELV